MEGKSQQGAAAASGMSVRTARTWQRGRLPSEKKGKRTWRTRPDPFAGVWAEEVEPLLRSDVEGALKATTILEWLDERHPGRFSLSQLRTLQRRLRDWRALSGPDREVFFEQEHPPGREAPGGLHSLRRARGDDLRRAVRSSAVPLRAEPFGMAVRSGSGNLNRGISGIAA